MQIKKTYATHQQIKEEFWLKKWKVWWSCCEWDRTELVGRSSTSAKFIKGCVCVPVCVCAAWRRVFSASTDLGPRGKTGIGFPPGAAGGRLQLTCDDLVRCERALSNLEANKLGVIFYEPSVRACLWALPRSPPCTVSPTDVFIKSAALGAAPA